MTIGNTAGLALMVASATPITTHTHVIADVTDYSPGAGSGDVVGPTSAYVGHFAKFSNVDGKHVSDGTISTNDVPDLSSTYATSGHTHTGYVASNTPITGASKAKITYDAKGLVTSGANLEAGDIPEHSHTGYVASNNAITPATNPKVTYDAKGLVTSGAALISTDIPDISAAYAINSKGVTNGDSHDHNGGDGAQIAHTGLSSIGTNTHAQIDTHIGIPNPGDISSYRRNGTTRPRWYTMPMTCSAKSVSGALTAGRMYAIPFFAPKASTTDYLAINCTTLIAGGEVRLGIYNDTNGEPSSLLIDAGIADTSGTGVKTVACAQALTGGSLYWLAALSKSATHAFRAPVIAGMVNVIGDDVAFPTTHITHFYAAQTYGALPGTFPTVTQGTGIVFPLIYARLSAGGK
jgi:hypothetical protein